MSASKSEQGSRVQLELELLRSKQLAKSQRDKLKDSTSLTSSGVCDRLAESHSVLMLFLVQHALL
jgi:hypothetical protein